MKGRSSKGAAFLVLFKAWVIGLTMTMDQVLDGIAGAFVI